MTKLKTSQPLRSATLQSPVRYHLQQLVLLRTMAITGQIVTVAGASWGLGVPLPLLPLLLASGFLGVFNVATWVRFKLASPVTDRELFVQVLVDVTVFTVLLYFTGGANNPFVFMYLLPLTVAAAALPPVYALSVTAVSLGYFTLVSLINIPLMLPADESVRTGLLVTGMWLNYLLTGGLIVYFVGKIAATLREHEHLLALARERQMNDEYVVGLGSLATAAAHELSGPLYKMGVLTKELEKDCETSLALTEKLRAMSAEIDSCKAALFNLLASAEQAAQKEGAR